MNFYFFRINNLLFSYSRFLMSAASKSLLRFVKLSENAFSPVKGSAHAAGWDLRRLVFHDVFIQAQSRNYISLVLMIIYYQHEEE